MNRQSPARFINCYLLTKLNAPAELAVAQTRIRHKLIFSLLRGNSLTSPTLLFYRLKRLFQILNDIVNVFGTDRESDGVRLDSLIFQFFLI